MDNQTITQNRILVCGTREWSNFDKIKTILKNYTPDSTLIIHGGCKGADSIAGYLANQLGFEVLIYKADWAKYGKAAGPKRNQQMLDEGKPTKVIAFHPDIENSKGTKDMITRTKKVNLPIEIIN